MDIFSSLNFMLFPTDTNVSIGVDFRSRLRRSGVSPDMERHTPAGETPALHFRSLKANGFWYDSSSSSPTPTPVRRLFQLAGGIQHTRGSGIFFAYWKSNPPFSIFGYTTGREGDSEGFGAFASRLL